MAILTTPFFVWLRCLITISQLIPSILALSDTYIIHMDLSAMPKAFSSHHSWYAATVSSSQSGIQVSDATTTTTTTTSSHIYTYTHVVHGFSAKLSPEELKAIQNLPGFVSSIRDAPVTIDTTRTPEYLHLNSVNGAWPKSNYGKGIIIGVVDTGVWPESDSFKDDGMPPVPSRWKGKCETGTAFNSSMCNKKLIGARYFNKGILSVIPNATMPMSSARDIDGHGTHTSSTAAGNYVAGASYFGYGRGTARGMAPLAHVAMYKALWDAGTYTTDLLAAIDQAIEDGVDVLSLSLGLDGLELYEDPVAIASFAAMQKGVFVAASSGNDGPIYGSLHNGAPWLLTVGAGSMDRELNGIVTLNNGVRLIGLSMFPRNSSLNQLPLVFMNNCNNSKRLNNVGYKIVVCRDTNNSIGTQLVKIRKAQVAAGIFITNATDLELYMQTSFPCIFVTHKDGKQILDYIKASNDPRATLELEKTQIGTKPAPLVAKYSSRGPSPSCPGVLKPDLIAPGTLVLASWTQANPVLSIKSHPLFSEFNIISGTSMSCPHAAGLAALLKSVHPEWSPAAIRSAMMTTADHMDNTMSLIKDSGDRYRVASPLAMGAGQINPNKALDPGLVYDTRTEDYVRLLCFMKYTKKQIHAITRSGNWNCSNPSDDLNYPSFIAFFKGNSSGSDAKVVKEFQRTVTNVGDEMATYKVRLAPMDGFQVTVVPNTLVFKEKYEKLSYKITIKGPRMMKQVVVHGSLSWVEIGGKRVVRSPIVATRLS